MFVSLWRPVAGCGTGVVGPKERLLQSQLLQPRLGDLYAVGLEVGIDLMDCRQVLVGFLAWRGVLSRSTLREVGGYTTVNIANIMYSASATVTMLINVLTFFASRTQPSWGYHADCLSLGFSSVENSRLSFSA